MSCCDILKQMCIILVVLSVAHSLCTCQGCRTETPAAACSRSRADTSRHGLACFLVRARGVSCCWLVTWPAPGAGLGHMQTACLNSLNCDWLRVTLWHIGCLTVKVVEVFCFHKTLSMISRAVATLNGGETVKLYQSYTDSMLRILNFGSHIFQKHWDLSLNIIWENTKARMEPKSHKSFCWYLIYFP